METEATPSNRTSLPPSPNAFDHLEQQIAERTKELAALNTIAAAVSQYLDLDQVLNTALDVTLQVMGIGAGGIYLLDEKADLLVVRALRGFSSEFAAAIDGLGVGEGYSGHVIQTGKPIIVKDISQDERLSRVAEWKTDVHSMAIIPLISKGKTLGVLFVATEGTRKLVDPEFQLLTSIGHQVGVAVDNARLFAIEQRRADQFRAINQVGRRITSILDTDELLSQMVELIRGMLGYPIVGIGLVEGDELVFRAGAAPRGKLPVDVRIKVGSGVTGWVVTSGTSLLVPDVSKEPRFISPVPVSSRSELAVPMKTKDAVIGVLNVESENLNAFDESDRIVLESLANQAAVAIENARLYEQARLLAVIEERHRLARDLHDSVTQSLYGVTLYSEAAAGQLALKNLDRAAAYLRVLRNTAQEALAEMRLLIYELRPPVLEEEGLVAALQARLTAVEGRIGLQTRLKVEGECRLPFEIEEGLYRIAQEALNNALKHAQAHNITVCLRFAPQGGDVNLDIVDDGAGFDREAVHGKGGLGLSTMKERATELGGRLCIESWPGEGTRVRVEVPL